MSSNRRVGLVVHRVETSLNPIGNYEDTSPKDVIKVRLLTRVLMGKSRARVIDRLGNRIKVGDTLYARGNYDKVEKKVSVKVLKIHRGKVFLSNLHNTRVEGFAGRCGWTRASKE